jgi:hypothetical protein
VTVRFGYGRATAGSAASIIGLGEDEFTHQDYMRAMGLEKTAHWPGFDDGDPLGGFRRLLSDLDHCAEFLTGDAASVLGTVRALPPVKTGFQALGS